MIVSLLLRSSVFNSTLLVKYSRRRCRFGVSSSSQSVSAGELTGEGPVLASGSEKLKMARFREVAEGVEGFVERDSSVRY